MQLLWKGLLAYVACLRDADRCSLRQGWCTDVTAMKASSSYLHHFHAMPEQYMVRARAELHVGMDRMPKDAIDLREGIRSLPAMLKGYVRAGCCIGDGAVVDHQFDTTDVFIFFPLSGIDARYQSRFGLVK